ncbi:cobyric acid synthase [Halanaerobium sp. Z-7514]|uniref:Cobyric acid synthase n=1 Tax=Halanaerobium polyolivorans TaxID=2886943 RepID=A0AAW4X101_9FIRM|nr:cobyric acid synthase [Halanaerobium polyolivorans]
MKNRADTLMIQATASDAGKSLFAAALCRIFSRRGIKTVPFKAWNMSLNSYVTKNGGEIGIAQALQAEAAGREPEVDMQPILIKAMGDGQTQVIIRGKADKNIYYSQEKKDYREIFAETIRNSLQKLRQENDLIIIEGAGSPAEINRSGPDFANMFTAEIYNSPVLLISNIDRGGALASLVGTLKLLSEKEKKLVQGLLINKFRGDFELLKPALGFLKEYTGKEVLGVIPYLKDLNLPEEDSASLKKRSQKNCSNKIKIGIIRLPHISNFSDFNSLKMEADVYLEYIEKAQSLNNFDLIIIPGSKTTTKDLDFIKRSGLAAKIKLAAQTGTLIMGICGGFQMLGRSLYDKHQTEGGSKKMEGLNLLPIDTEFLPDKTTHQVEAVLNNKLEKIEPFSGFDFNKNLKGYEIHMGITKYLEKSKPLFELQKRSGEKVKIMDGAVDLEGNCIGSYLHGLFDNDSFRRSLINYLKEKKNLSLNKEKAKSLKNSYHDNLQKELNRLADIVESRVDIDKLLNLSRRS